LNKVFREDPVWLVNWTIAFALILSGTVYLVLGGYWHPITIVFPVYPVSYLMMGGLVIGLDYRFREKMIPLLVMMLGAFDVLVRMPNGGLLLWILDSSFIFQIVLMVGGWFLAKRPKFVINRWFWLMLLAYGLFVGQGMYYHIFELALFTYVIMGGVEYK